MEIQTIKAILVKVLAQLGAGGPLPDGITVQYGQRNVVEWNGKEWAPFTKQTILIEDETWMAWSDWDPATRTAAGWEIDNDL